MNDPSFKENGVESSRTPHIMNVFKGSDIQVNGHSIDVEVQTFYFWISLSEYNNEVIVTIDSFITVLGTTVFNQAQHIRIAS